MTHSTSGGALRGSIVLLALLPLTLLSLIAAICWGATSLSPSEVLGSIGDRLAGRPAEDAAQLVVWDLRVPRALLALIAGAGLGLAGAALRIGLRETTADPYTTGLSAGALGATAIAVALGLVEENGLTTALIATVGALLAATAVLVASLRRGGRAGRVPVAGIVVSAVLFAVAAIVVTRTSDGVEPGRSWLLGGLQTASREHLIAPAVVVALALVALTVVAAFSGAGADPVGLRLVLVAGAAVLVGFTVPLTGAIGFVGLIASALAGLAAGSIHWIGVPVAAGIGSVATLWADLAARTLASPAEFPLTAVTAAVGVPLFVILLVRDAGAPAGGARRAADSR